MASSKVKSITLSQIFNCFTISLVFVDRIISNYFTIINFKQMNELKKIYTSYDEIVWQGH